METREFAGPDGRKYRVKTISGETVFNLPESWGLCEELKAKLMAANERIKVLEEALAPLANKDIPKKTTGYNSGAYSFRYEEIRAAKQALAKSKEQK